MYLLNFFLEFFLGTLAIGAASIITLLVLKILCFIPGLIWDNKEEQAEEKKRIDFFLRD